MHPPIEAVFDSHGVESVASFTSEDALHLELAAPFESLGTPRTFQQVTLGPLANRLDLFELRRFLHRATFLLEERGRVHFVTRDPDDYPADAWPGEIVQLEGHAERVRPLRHFLELLRLFPLDPRTPRALKGESNTGDRFGRLLQWTAVRLPSPVSDERDTVPVEERYAPTRDYRRFDRLEEPETADDLYYAASRLRPGTGETILALGVNDGRELEMFSPAVRDQVELWGIDHSAEAIESARRRHPQHAERMLHADLSDLGKIGLPPVDCVLLLNVLRCTSVDRERLLRDLIPLMTPKARLLASIPNCHFGPRGILRRPLERADARHDRSLVLKDARFLARALYRAGFQSVETFGTLDVMILARR